MIGEVQFSQDRATHQQIAAHLRLCDAHFVPPLSSRVEIAAYAHKLVSHATRFEAWQQGRLIGLIAAYCNEAESRCAYISNVSVLAELQHHGVATQLLKRCLQYMNEREFAHVELEVDSRNDKAIRLYQRFGFQMLRADGSLSVMSLRMGEVGADEQLTGL